MNPLDEIWDEMIVAKLSNPSKACILFFRIFYNPPNERKVRKMLYIMVALGAMLWIVDLIPETKKERK